MGVYIMKTESNRKPDSIEIRKLGVNDDSSIVYLYLNSDIKQETETIDGEPRTTYTYDSTQLTTPLPVSLLPEIDTALINQHGYNQTDYKQKTVKHLEEIKKGLKEATKYSVKQVDRLDKLIEVNDLSLVSIQKEVEITVKQL